MRLITAAHEWIRPDDAVESNLVQSDMMTQRWEDLDHLILLRYVTARTRPQ